MGRRLQRLRRMLVTSLKAFITCHAQRAAPTLTTIFEIAALAAPLIKAQHHQQRDASTDTAAPRSHPVALSPASSSSSSTSAAAGVDVDATAGSGGGARGGGSPRQQQHAHSAAQDVLAPPVDVARTLVLIALRLARGWAPAVVVAQGLRLVGSLVQHEHAHDDVRREGTEVRALQLGLSTVPRVDPRVLAQLVDPRVLAQLVVVYKEWLLLLRGRLARSGIELPEGLFDDGQEGDEELIRFALPFNLLQARSLKDALVAMDRTLASIRDFSCWHAKENFIAPADLECYQRITWWEGPDDEGQMWLMVDFRAAVHASRTHGPELCSRVLVSNMEYGVRSLIPELGCATSVRVVVDCSGLNTPRGRAVLQRFLASLDRYYPSRLHVLYVVGLSWPLRQAVRGGLQLLHAHTRRRVRVVHATEVPRRLPSQLRSHKLSVAAGMDGWWDGGGGADAAEPAAQATAAGGAGSVVDSDLGTEPFTPRTPMLMMRPQQQQQQQQARAFRWRRGGGGSRLCDGGGSSDAFAAGHRRRVRARLLAGSVVVLGTSLLLLLCSLLLLEQLVPELRSLVSRRLLALLRRLGLRAAAVAAGGGPDQADLLQQARGGEQQAFFLFLEDFAGSSA